MNLKNLEADFARLRIELCTSPKEAIMALANINAALMAHRLIVGSAFTGGLIIGFLVKWAL